MWWQTGVKDDPAALAKRERLFKKYPPSLGMAMVLPTEAALAKHLECHERYAEAQEKRDAAGPAQPARTPKPVAAAVKPQSVPATKPAAAAAPVLSEAEWKEKAAEYDRLQARLVAADFELSVLQGTVVVTAENVDRVSDIHWRINQDNCREKYPTKEAFQAHRRYQAKRS